MPINKDLKRLVRARMVKTGEAYTSARANLLKKAAGAAEDDGVAGLLPAARAASAADFAKLAGKSDEAIKAKTGCTWDRWVWALDYVNAYQWPHREIAKYVHQKYKVDRWWAQTVTVGYERIKGIREIGQRRSGEYEVNKSRTMPVSASKLFRAFSQPRQRSQWLSGVTLAVRSATPNKYLRITWEDGSPVQVGFLSKARSKAQVAVQHGKLPSKEAANRMKQFWTERLDALAQLLGT